MAYRPYTLAPAYVPSPRKRRQAARTNRPTHLGAYVLATVVAVGLVSMVPRAANAIWSAHLEGVVSSVKTKLVVTEPPVDTVKLQTDLSGVIAAHPKTRIGVSVVDISTGTQVTAGSTLPFTGASTTKVLAAAAFLHNVEQGKIDGDKKIAGYAPEWQLKQMLNRSNNTSWELLIKKVGRTQLQAYARSLGLTSYKVNGNTMSAADDAKLLSLLQQRKLLNEENTATLLSYMHTTNNEVMLPAAMPPGAVLRHKYGQLDEFLHDTGIVTYNNRTYALSVYTAGLDGTDYAARTALIRELTRTVIADMPEGKKQSS